MGMNMSVIVSNLVLQALESRTAWAAARGPEPLWPNGPTPQEYMRGFLRQQGMGSYVTYRVGQLQNLPIDTFEKLSDLFFSIAWEEFVPEGAKAGHKYLRGKLPEKYTGYSGVKQLKDLDDIALTGVRLRRGPHGIELTMPGVDAMWVTKDVVAILDEDGLVTWYPGQLTPPIELDNATVKLT